MHGWALAGLVVCVSRMGRAGLVGCSRLAFSVLASAREICIYSLEIAIAPNVPQAAQIKSSFVLVCKVCGVQKAGLCHKPSAGLRRVSGLLFL